MTKRILAVLMALVMVLGLLPVGVIAQDITHADETHSCEHCQAAVTWTAWDGTAAMEDGGHYVLTADVTLAAPVALTEGSFVLCLGGYTLTCATTAFQLSGTASLTVTDCTAKTEEEVYTAGVITGATTSAIRVEDEAVFTMHGGILSGNTNTSTASTEGGGAVLACDKAQVNLLGGVLSGNTSGKYGGAVFARNNAKVSLENMTVTGNESQVGGAIYGTGAVAFTVKDTTVTGNTGTHTSTTNAGYAAAVYMSGSTLTFTVSGKVVIADNKVTSGNVKVPDLELGHEGCDTLLVNELTEGSNIVFGTYKTAVTGADMSQVIAVSGTQTDWNSHWVTYKYGNGNTELVGRNAEGAFSTGHYHDGQLYTPITNNVDMKNAAGYCYLTTDLNLGGEQTRNKDLHLCLNGHTIKAKAGKRIFTTSDKTPAVFTIEDCTAYTDENGVYHAGKLTGGQNTATGGGAIYLAAGNTLNLVDGIICGNTSSVIGGAILAYGTVNISGGEISGNSAIADGAYKNGGAIALNAGSKLTMTGGTIKDNVSKGGGAIYAGKTTLEISGGKITGNEAKENGGAIFSTGTGELTISGGEITGNTAGILGGGIYCQTGLRLSGEPVIKDNTGGNLYLVDQALLTVGEMGENANVGISAAVAPRAISEALDQDRSGSFFSDVRFYQVLYRDNALYLEVFSDHPHCAESCLENCEHEKLQFIPWEQSDSLPVSGCYYLATDVQLTQETVLSGDLQLCLNGHTVTAAEGKRILSTTANADIQIVLSDCTAAETDGVYTAGKLTGGRDQSTAGGGAMYLRAGTTLSMYDGILTDNQSVAAGGAIAAATGAKVELYGGAITGNQAVDAEGKAKNGGGVFLNVDAEMVASGGEVSANQGAYGGGIYVNKAKLTLTDGVICDNKASTGGGIQVSADGQLTIEGGVIEGNSATTNGGGIYGATGSTFTMTGGAVKNNISSSNGGGIYLLKLTTAFAGGEISGNSAVTGGGLYFNGTTVTINKLTVSGNKAQVGAGIYGKSVTSKNAETGEDEDFPVSVKLGAEAVIKNNSASKNGGGICITGKNAMLDMPAGTITGNYGKNAGGVLLMGKSTMKLSGGSISGNSANSGGGIYVSTDCTLRMVGGSVSGNRSTKNGGGIYMLRSTASFSGGVVSSNQGVAGGGLYVSGGKATLQGTTFTGNTATKNGGAVMSTVSSTTKNGVKDVAYSTVTVTAGLITKNTAINAGGLLVQSRGCELNIQGGKITENTATSSGGGIYVSTNGTLNMSGGEVTNNVALKSSGGINHYRSIGNYTGGIISGNKAATGGGMTVGGGETCNVTIEKLTITNNEAERAGGGILVQGKSNLHVGAVEITGNTSGKIGGGICISSQTHITMDGTQLANNTANTEGGGVYVYTASSAVMDNVTMTGNHAVKTGGGIFSRGRLILTNSYIQLNTCDGDGGGIGTYRVGINRIGKNSYMTVENTVVSGNTCGGKGGGVYLSIGHPAELKNMRITGNTSGAEGGGIWSGCHLTMDSLTITDNQSGGEGYAVYLTESRYDGQSFVGGVLKMQGDTVIRDNNGGDMFLGEDATISIPGGVLGENAYVHVNLASGLLTNQVLGSYDYEGGNQDYIITAGSRSMTEPEIAPTEEAPTEEPTEAPTGDDTGSNGTGALVAGIAGVCLVVVAAAIIIVLMAKKKKSAQK